MVIFGSKMTIFGKIWSTFGRVFGQNGQNLHIVGAWSRLLFRGFYSLATCSFWEDFFKAQFWGLKLHDTEEFSKNGSRCGLER